MHQKVLLKWIWIIYLFVMVWLLFGGRLASPHPFGACNPIPFSTISSQLSLLDQGLAHRRFALVNLVGNVAMFVPAGYLVPQLFPRFQRVLPFLGLFLLCICGVEVVQFVTGLGALDVDDVILNLAGVLAGYLLFRCHKKFITKEKTK